VVAPHEAEAGPRHSEVTGHEQAGLEPVDPVPEECVVRRETAGNGEGHVKNSHPIADLSPPTLL
jgi:hypothetical protein